MKIISQLDLINLLENNPLGISVCFNEVDVENKDYIFVDALNDLAVKGDNKALDYINEIQIQVYCDSIDDLNTTLRYVKDNFICSVERYKDDNYNVATCITQLKVKDWS